MLISEISLEELNRDQITHLLYGKENELDNGTVKGDCIFVFGGTYMERTEKAVDLFNHGRAPYVLCLKQLLIQKATEIEVII
jgi:hypothetical protein